MTQVDILLGVRSREYDLRLGDTIAHDVRLNERTHRGTVPIYGLVDRRGVYGDELEPLIVYLNQSEVGVLLESYLLNEALLYIYDLDRLSELDQKTIDWLDRGGGYNLVKLLLDKIDLSNALTVDPMENRARLTLDITERLHEYTGLSRNELHLHSEAAIRPNTFAGCSKSIAHLIDTIADGLRKTCILVLNDCGLYWFDGYLHEYDPRTLGEMDRVLPKMSLLSPQLRTYLAFIFGDEAIETSLRSVIADFLSQTILLGEYNDMALTFDIAENSVMKAQLIVRQVLSLVDYGELFMKFMDDVPLFELDYKAQHDDIFRLGESMIETITVPHLTSDPLHVCLLSSEVETVLAKSFMEGASALSVHLKVDDLYAYRGFATYDGQLLMDLDGFTVYELGDEIQNSYEEENEMEVEYE